MLKSTFLTTVTTVVTATTVDVTWTNQTASSSSNFTLMLNRTGGEEGAICTMVEDTRSRIPIAPNFTVRLTGLEEYSNYEVCITEGSTLLAWKQFTTLSARKGSCEKC